MKHLLITIAALAALAACTGQKTPAAAEADSTEVAIVDSALYGTVGEGTTMHTLHLITTEGKAIELAIDQDTTANVQGGLFAGDRVTLTCAGSNVLNLVNLTSLCGHWTALDRNFTINADGTVTSTNAAESRPYTAWQTVNTRLVLNTDTFDILSLGPDSLELESTTGVFVYKRQSK